MKKSPLQIARAAYQPKMPASITGNPVIVEGKATESVADQADIKKLFPNTYGLPIVTFENGDKAAAAKAINVGVILSGGQAPGGHNVISGIFWPGSANTRAEPPLPPCKSKSTQKHCMTPFISNR